MRGMGARETRQSDVAMRQVYAGGVEVVRQKEQDLHPSSQFGPSMNGR
jgi:hypothetical protein